MTDEKLTWKALSPGDYISAEELTDDQVVLMTIKHIESKVLEGDDGGKSKGVVWFKETGRGWVLNTTNTLLLGKIWPKPVDADGKKIAITRRMVMAFGEMMPGLLVYGSPELSEDMDISIQVNPRKKKKEQFTLHVMSEKQTAEPLPEPEDAQPDENPDPDMADEEITF